MAGSTGLVGSELLSLLLADPACTAVHALLRKHPAQLPNSPALPPKLHLHVVDFALLPTSPALPACDRVYIALGTTIKVAGSQEAFRRVDVDAVVAVARAARTTGASRLALVSALGAHPNSRTFYNRAKGDAEAAVTSLGFARVVIAQPSLILGDRSPLGQPERTGEAWAQRLLRPIRGLIPRSVRPIEASAIAAAMHAAMQSGEPGVQRLVSGAMLASAP
ncbi:MAG: hypothetical protein RLZZ618_935 [Pseudomonadota bacterium]|jgi:uncharacterized protein YbjT (DUF2867 family)